MHILYNNYTQAFLLIFTSFHLVPPYQIKRPAGWRSPSTNPLLRSISRSSIGLVCSEREGDWDDVVDNLLAEISERDEGDKIPPKLSGAFNAA